MKDTPIERLKGCPFCGRQNPAERVIRDVGCPREHAVYCEGCGGAVLTIGGQQTAAERWNTRATIEPIPSAGEGERAKVPCSKCGIEDMMMCDCSLPSEPLRDD